MELSRATLAVDLTYFATLSAPLVSLLSFRLARRRRYEQHRLVQLVLLGLCWASVLAFELQLRLSGGSGAFVDAAAPAFRAPARLLLLVHIGAAVVTYAAWSWLAARSLPRFRSELPGTFSRLHKRLGKLVFWGLCFTALSATGMYLLAFVLE